MSVVTPYETSLTIKIERVYEVEMPSEKVQEDLVALEFVSSNTRTQPYNEMLLPKKKVKNIATLEKEVVKNKRKKTICAKKWCEEALKCAMEAVHSGKMSQRAAARMYSIPISTLHDHLKSGKTAKSLGKKRVFTDDQEQELMSLIYEFSRKDVPITSMFIKKQAFLYCEKHGIKNSFNTSKRIAGIHWLNDFLRRNPMLRQLITSKHQQPGKLKIKC